MPSPQPFATSTAGAGAADRNHGGPSKRTSTALLHAQTRSAGGTRTATFRVEMCLQIACILLANFATHVRLSRSVDPHVVRGRCGGSVLQALSPDTPNASDTSRFRLTRLLAIFKHFSAFPRPALPMHCGAVTRSRRSTASPGPFELGVVVALDGGPASRRVIPRVLRVLSRGLAGRAADSPSLRTLPRRCTSAHDESPRSPARSPRMH